MSDLLFVYGTLRCCSSNSRFHLFSSRAEYLGIGRVHGVLYELGGYPGLVPAEKAAVNPWVYGEIYRLESVDSVLAVLDEYEGCGERHPAPREFERVLTNAFLTDNSILRVWVYKFRGDFRHRQRILSGDYCKCEGSATDGRTPSFHRY